MIDLIVFIFVFDFYKDTMGSKGKDVMFFGSEDEGIDESYAIFLNALAKITIRGLCRTRV